MGAECDGVAETGAAGDGVDGQGRAFQQVLGEQHPLGEQPLQGRTAGAGAEPPVECASAQVGATGEGVHVGGLVEVGQDMGDDVVEGVAVGCGRYRCGLGFALAFAFGWARVTRA